MASTGSTHQADEAFVFVFPADRDHDEREGPFDGASEGAIDVELKYLSGVDKTQAHLYNVTIDSNTVSRGQTHAYTQMKITTCITAFTTHAWQ
eukprot:326575-Rhodomonas_salina.2